MLTSPMMAYSDHYIYETLRRLVPEQPKLTYAEIAAACPIQCSERTVLRAVDRLEKQGLIGRQGGGRGNARGYTFNICGASA